jgi:hypothetical protein
LPIPKKLDIWNDTVQVPSDCHAIVTANSANKIWTLNTIVTETTNADHPKAGWKTTFLKVTAPVIEAVAEIIIKETEAEPVADMVRSKPVLPCAGGATVNIREIDIDIPGLYWSESPWLLSAVAVFDVVAFFPGPGQLIVNIMLPDGMHIKRAHAKSSEPATEKVKLA